MMVSSPLLAQRERGVHAAVVELDALADAVGAAAEDDDLAAVGRRLALVLVGRVEVGRVGGELGGAGVDALVDRAHAEAWRARATSPPRWRRQRAMRRR
jgi:predicted signal transduction protein with EAL and GGDEF domain